MSDARTSAATALDHVPASRHLVHFYSDDDALGRAIARFAQHGIRRREAVALIVTPAHRRALAPHLLTGDLDVPGDGSLIVLDAPTTLAGILRAGRPDRDAFAAMIEDVVHRAYASGHRHVRCYGEMVDLLWPGRAEAALGLEALWNEALVEHEMSLLCAYRDERASTGPRAVAPVLRCHTHVLAGEMALPTA